jgi:cardiolipin synthase
MLLLGRLIFSRLSSRTILQNHSCIFRSVACKKQLFPSKFLLRCTSTSSDQQKTDRIWTIPNILTFARIGSSPILGYLIISHQYSAALTLFLVSGLTDLIDGWIARRYPSQASALGSFLDPFADKMLVGIVVISLAYVNLIPLWLLALILSRDIVIMFVAAYLRIKSVPPPRTLKKILNMKNATVQLYPTFVSKVGRINVERSQTNLFSISSF